MKTFLNQELENYAKKHTQPGPPLLAELEAQTYESMAIPHMLSGHLPGRLLSLIAKMARPKLILEIGTFTGYSALCLAQGLGKDGKLITCEINEDYAKMAREFFDKSPNGHKIEIRLKKAMDTLHEIKTPIDLAFIDADKEQYPDYYERLVEVMPRGGIILIDNCFWSGEVLNPKGKEATAIHKLNKIVAKDNRVENVLLTIRDGINFIRKL